MWESPSLEIVLKTGQWMVEIFKAHAGIDVFLLQFHIDIGVGLRPVAVLFGADVLVFLGYQHVALHAPAHYELVVVLGMEGGRKQQRQ